MEIAVQIAQLILSLSILVVIHELGHFIPAKLFKTRVEKFYLFFDPKFSLFKYKYKDTEYGVGWLPLGGYVKIAGMVDESLDKAALKQTPQSWEFRSKPAWQRFIIMIGGVFFNMVLAFLIYIAIVWQYGETKLKNDQAIYGIYADSALLKLGFQNGDKILKMNHQQVTYFSDITLDLLLQDIKTVELNRNNQLLTLELPDNYVADLLKHKKQLLSPAVLPIIAAVSDKSVAQQAGLLEGDLILSINQIQIKFPQDIKKILQANLNQTILIEILRNEEKMQISALLNNLPSLGVFIKSDVDQLHYENVNYTFFQAIPAGFIRLQNTFSSYIDQLKLIVKPETKAYESVGGFISIGKVFPPIWDWFAFWNITAFLSIALAIMNMLPIPALDGGHLVFLLYEIFTKRKPTEKVLEYAQYVGMIILLTLMLYANGMDLFNLIETYFFS